MSATAAKVAVLNVTTALTGACPTGAQIIDLVGYGATANCSETAVAPAPSTTTADIRAGGGCTDSDNNSTDFTAIAPNPRNTSTALAPCSVATPTPTPTLNINDVTQAEGNSGTTSFNFTVSLTSPAPAGGVTFNASTADGTTNPANAGSDYVALTNQPFTITAGNTSTTVTVTVNGDTTIEPNETFFVNITNVTGAIAGDTQGLGTITNDDVVLTPIYNIQGSGSTSPLAGQSVSTSGIVTGIKAGSSGGFFLQDPSGDGNPNTSDGVFVFTGSTVPAGAVIGNSVQVTGTVQEFVFSSDPNSPPETEISSVTSTIVLSTGNPLPAPHTLTAAETTAPSGTTNPLDSLEEFEGMRVIVPSLTVVAPTQGTITEPSATVSSTGVFYGVVTGVARPFREPGINISDPLPAGAPANVPRFDENPERIRVDSDGQPGTTALDVTAGTIITSVTGPLDYSFRTYTILPDAATPPVVGALATATAVPTPTNTEFTVASFNMERFFDTVADGESGAPTLTATAFNNRLNKASLIIRNVQRYPDVIGVEEMENLTTLQAVANKINGDAQSIDGLPNPNYTAYLVEGNDVGGIDVGFLVKASRVTVVDVTQYGKDTTFTNPDSSTALLNDRPPLVLRATIARPASLGTLPFTVIVNHLRSLSGVDSTVAGTNGWATEGDRIRAKRRAQAEYLANLIQTRQTNDPTEKIISVGDYNAFQINDGYVDVIGTIKGTPAPPDQVVLASPDLVNPDLTDLVDTLPADQRYSYSFDGNAQVLDHQLLNPNALSILTRFAYARDDADFPVIDYQDPSIPLRISDHDQPVAYFSLVPIIQPGQLVISEFRTRGTNGANDEFIELDNNTNSDLFVNASDGSAGYAVAASDGVARCIVPNNTVIPARGHYLCVNSSGYSLGSYPAGNGTTATGDATYTTDIPEDAGIAIFNNSTGGASFSSGNRLDAVGFTTTANTLYREGAGLPAPGANDGNYAFVRKLTTGVPQDTGDNAQDFTFVSTNAGSFGGVQSQLGAPGPENSTSPIQRNAQIKASLIEPQAASSSAPNRVRSLTSVTNGAQGTLSIRRRFTNSTGQTVTRLRFRIVDITTLNSPGYAPGGGQADVRAIDASDFNINTSLGALTVRGVVVEQPPTQPNGGGVNSTLTIALPGGALSPGQSIDLHFLLGVQQSGNFRFFVNVEALP
jgi:predicted extracellular nuclease